MWTIDVVLEKSIAGGAGNKVGTTLGRTRVEVIDRSTLTKYQPYASYHIQFATTSINNNNHSFVDPIPLKYLQQQIKSF